MRGRLACGFALMVALLGPPATAGDQSARSSGALSLLSGSASARADALVAGADGAEWALPGGPRLRAAPGSELRVFSRPSRMVFAGGRRALGYTVFVRKGRVEVAVGDIGPTAVIVVLDRLAAIVESGCAHAVSTRKSSAVAVVHGRTTVRARSTLSSAADRAFRQIAPGSMMDVNRARVSIDPMIAPPRGVEGRRVWLASKRDHHELSWQPVPGASGYRLELRRLGQERPVARAASAGPLLRTTFDELAPGDYELDIYSVDAFGIASSRPTSTPVRVVGVELPAGAYVDNRGEIRLAEDQVVRLINAKGLEVSYGRAPQRFRAPETVRVHGKRRTLVHLALPGASNALTVSLAPRSVRARVEAGPKTVTWPEQPVQVQIELIDPTGEPIPDFIAIVPRVTLELEETKVAFRRDGRRWYGIVPPQPGPGPWIVRVEVFDQFGVLLGRDFVEVARREGRVGEGEPKLARH